VLARLTHESSPRQACAPSPREEILRSDGEEQFETVALGWTGHNVYLRMPDRCYRFTAVWLNAADVTRH